MLRFRPKPVIVEAVQWTGGAKRRRRFARFTPTVRLAAQADKGSIPDKRRSPPG